VANLKYLHMIRTHELSLVMTVLKNCGFGPGAIIIELGAGTGYQAKLLEQAGFHVVPLDLRISAYTEDRVYPVIEYDGKNIPLKPGSVDVVFSSNVLEHVLHIDEFLKELGAVSKEGFAIHVLPTASCRFWSMIAHYAWIIKRVFQILFIKKSGVSSESRILKRKNPLLDLYPNRHGERGNFLTEMFYYTEKWWKKKFNENGYRVDAVIGVGIFYTMSNIFEGFLSIRTRKKCASFLGSSCKIYILKKCSSI
jgi:SAM-dependent methyltransferase